METLAIRCVRFEQINSDLAEVDKIFVVWFAIWRTP